MSLAFLKLTLLALSYYQISTPLGVIFFAQVVTLGWIVSMLDDPIYMLFEGRRFSPKFCFILGRKMERKRLFKLLSRMRHADNSCKHGNVNQTERFLHDRCYLEAAVNLSDFPLNPKLLKFEARWPTRLGNLIAAYEGYPRIKYGMDAVYFWPRIWVTLDKDLRAEIDNQQAQVDGVLYVIFTLLVSSLTFFGYAVFDLFSSLKLPFNFGYISESILAVVCLILARFLYRISLFSHSQFGDLFKSIFDQFRSNINIDETVKMLATVTCDPNLYLSDERNKNLAAWRFLKWQRVRVKGSQKNRLLRLP